MQKVLQFVSISTDGDIILWTLAKSELQRERLMLLKSSNEIHGVGVAVAAAAGAKAQQDGPDAVPKHLLGGLCMDFSKVRALRRRPAVGPAWQGLQACMSAFMHMARLNARQHMRETVKDLSQHQSTRERGISTCSFTLL